MNAEARDLLEVMIRSVWADVGATSADVLASNCVRVLADAGLLVTDADRAVLDAAETWAKADHLASNQPYGTARNVWRKKADALERPLLRSARARREGLS